MSTSATIGSRVRAFRGQIEISTSELAKLAGLDSALVEGIENDTVYPSIGVMARLARALGQRLGTFMDDQYRPDPLIVRAADRHNTPQPGHKAAEGPGNYGYFPLGRGKTDRHMEPFYIEIAPGKDEVLSTHEGEEFIVVVSGAVELTYGKEKHLLQAGDSAHYNSIVHHLVRAHGDKPAAIYAVIFVPF